MQIKPEIKNYAAMIEIKREIKYYITVIGIRIKSVFSRSKGKNMLDHGHEEP